VETTHKNCENKQPGRVRCNSNRERKLGRREEKGVKKEEIKEESKFKKYHKTKAEEWEFSV